MPSKGLYESVSPLLHAVVVRVRIHSPFSRCILSAIVHYPSNEQALCQSVRSPPHDIKGLARLKEAETSPRMDAQR